MLVGVGKSDGKEGTKDFTQSGKKVSLSEKTVSALTEKTSKEKQQSGDHRDHDERETKDRKGGKESANGMLADGGGVCYERVVLCYYYYYFSNCFCYLRFVGVEIL
jgi:hypothetical protein